MKEEVRELRLDVILESIEHGTSVTEKTKGLNNLKALFEQPSIVEALSDKSYHKICEILFKTALGEKAAYLSTKKSAKNGATLSRLVTCGDVLRQVVKVGVLKLKSKTIEAVVDHITQTLPKSNGGFFEPLIQTYLRTLNIIFEHPANVEHLKSEVWLDTVDFCLQGINHYLECNNGESISLVRSFSGLRANPSGSRAQSVSSNGAGELQASTLNRQNLEEVFQILLFLVSTPNVPLIERYSVMADSAVRFLQLQGSIMGHSNVLALSVINNILRTTRSDRTSFSQSVAVEAIPIIARFWQGKSASKDEMLNSVRDEMMILIFLVHPHLERAIRDGMMSDLLPNLEDLVDVLRLDHRMRSERDSTIHLDDLEMSDFGSTPPRPFRLNAFQLRSHNVRAERHWANLQVIGILEQLVNLGYTSEATTLGDDAEMDVHPSKRQRVRQTSDRLLEPLKSENENVRLCGLQFLPFILQHIELSTTALTDMLGQLFSCIGDNRGTLSSWALLAVASCTFQDSISNVRSAEIMQLWRAGMRCLTFSATCRASALALHALIGRNVVQYHDVGEDVGSIVSAANTNGPAVLCDSSILLMAHFLHTRVSESPSASLSASRQVIQWLFARWNPVDKDFANHQAIHIQPHHILVLLRTSLGLHQLPVSTMIFPCGPVAQAWQHHLNTNEIIRYLLLLEKFSEINLKWNCPSCPKKSKPDEIVYTLSTSHFQSVQKIILEPLQLKCTKVLQDWKEYLSGRTSPVSIDIYQSTLYCCISLLLLTSHFMNTALESSQSFATSVVDLSKELIGFQNEIEARDPDIIQALRGVLVQAVQPVLPSCGTENFRKFVENCPHLVAFLSLVADESAKHISPSMNESFEKDEDFMDLDDDFHIRKGHSKVEVSGTTMPRQNLSLELWSGSFDLTVSGKLHLIASINLSPDNIGFVPSVFIDRIVSLTEEEFLASHYLIQEICLSDLVLYDDDAYRLIERSGTILSSTEFDRCEVVLSVCVEILTNLDRLWSSFNGSEVADSAFQIYQWFITKALGKGVASAEVQRHISKLLLGLLRTNPDYATSDSMPSPRSSLFGILHASAAPVKFYIGTRIHEIFELFSLKDHDAIFVDILQNLPSDKDWIEGISFRLFVLARLGSVWPTLLRRSIYHIFETPGRVPGCLQYATRCLEDMASTLAVIDARELFTLFSGQLLYTWLDFADIKDIPYQIFGFPSLRDLVESAKAEATALMIMRGQDEAVPRLAAILELGETELLQASFSKVMAYTIAHTISTPPSDGTKKKTTGESRVKKSLGLEIFNECINNQFTDIIAIFFSTLDQDSPVEKYFKKSHNLSSAAKILEKIKNLSSSDRSLPPNLQPSFKVKFLSAEIEHMCKKTEHESSSLYTPALVTSIVRKLLQLIHPALGSLHACAVLRKIRIVISLAGDAAIQGYPLEMLLQSIRPFIKDSECADDAIGILQYLLGAGTVYLLQVPSFVGGVALSILGSLTSFLDATKASTTQESQHKKSLSKAQEFHKWMDQYLRNYNSPALKSAPSRRNFQLLIESALMASPIGNADRDTAESHLLLQLLKDEQTEDLLSRPSRELALSMLSSDFRGPTSFRNDLLGSDELSMAYASVVWKTCRGAASKQYQCWGARVLGRAFAASGHVHEELLHESSLSQIRNPAFVNLEDDSVAAVLSLLQEMTLVHDVGVAGVAESALRFILANADESLIITCQKALAEPLLIASSWAPYQIPPTDMPIHSTDTARLLYLQTQDAITEDHWLRDFSCAVAQSVPNDPILGALVPVLSKVPGFSDRAFPFILHLVLSTPYEGHRISKKDLSASFMRWLGSPEIVPKNNLKMIIDSIIYLRTQPIPSEKTSAERAHWLDIDYVKASKAATLCGMFKTALLFFEEFHSQPIKFSRRSSTLKNIQEPFDYSREALLEIYENIDDPDLYYGVQQHSNLNTILARFEYEKDGPKSLAFRGAQYDNHVRRHDPDAAKDIQSLVKALNVLDLNGLSNSLLQAQQPVGMTPIALKSMFETARKLEQWDIPVPSNCSNDSVAVYKAFQAVQTAVDQRAILDAVNEGLEYTMSNLIGNKLNANALHESLQTLAALVEMDEILSACGSEQFEEVFSRFQIRSTWMKVGRFDDISQILSCRGTSLSTLSQKPKLRDSIQVNALDCRLVEVNTALLSARINRSHNVLQESLSLATSMIDLIQPCHEVGVNAEVAIHLEVANALWDQGEMSSSIGMLQALDSPAALKNQTIPVGRSQLLSKIGHQISVARLEKPDQIIENYLRPAISELKGKTTGSEAGQVLHQFAIFCDQQLHDANSLEDLERLERLSQNKAEEVKMYDKLISGATSSNEKKRYQSYQNKSKTWLKLDQEELQRHRTSRDIFLRQCLENYLLALAASDDHNNNALRFSALWLQHSEKEIANEAVSSYLDRVPSRKFAPLMNQLTSRLQDDDSKFQQLMFSLVLKICTDHPYHGMYQIYTGVKTHANAKDESAISRRGAAMKVAKTLSAANATKPIWTAILHTSNAYCNLAGEKDEARYRSGRKVHLKDSVMASALAQSLIKYKIPPPTMKIALAANSDYSNVPVAVGLSSEFSIASGVSAPKIITVRVEDGSRSKQLVKGGNDDLRQDAIMEQVFEQVNELLKTHRSTQQRNLSIRTYRVLPLTNIAGVIEFVAETVPFHEYLMPAHERHYPKDLKGADCRREIGAVQQQSVEIRLKKFRSVMDRFHPVMRYFFTENFVDPDEWFVRRLAYTRSTAAISILGHILGLGDRHGHNILLDTKSGEVVHIDLGVAFEMGRILPVPELVPFRLTRDIVDGMGITKTEGVFRRCCEFTLETLREEVYSIMSILDVLRYDPLYTWSISPVRLAKIQEDRSAALEVAEAGRAVAKSKGMVNEPGEADRALTVVNKKLSKTLSVTATVNDLINQASDEKNLAVLYSGWAAYA